MTELSTALDELWTMIEARRGASPETSYTAKLLARGPAQCAKKFGEEAVEVVIAALSQDKDATRAEIADVLYHLFVLMAAVGVTPDEVGAALAARQGTSGLAEKASRTT